MPMGLTGALGRASVCTQMLRQLSKSLVGSLKSSKELELISLSPKGNIDVHLHQSLCAQQYLLCLRYNQSISLPLSPRKESPVPAEFTGMFPPKCNPCWAPTVPRTISKHSRQTASLKTRSFFQASII